MVSSSSEPFIYPFMRYQDARAAIDFLCKAFGFEQRMLVPGEGMIMVGTGGSPKSRGVMQSDIGRVEQGLYVFVAEPDAHCEHARGAGAKITREPENTDYGSREYSALDLEGYHWSFGTYHPAAEDGGA